jgi:hypothetical protein
VPEGGDEGANEELQYVDIAQGLDPGPEGPKVNLAREGKPRIINAVFFKLCHYLCYDRAFTFQELN